MTTVQGPMAAFYPTVCTVGTHGMEAATMEFITAIRGVDAMKVIRVMSVILLILETLILIVATWKQDAAVAMIITPAVVVTTGIVLWVI